MPKLLVNNPLIKVPDYTNKNTAHSSMGFGAIFATAFFNQQQIANTFFIFHWFA